LTDFANFTLVRLGGSRSEQRTALINRIRGLLSELGVVLPLKASTVRREAHKHLEDLPGWCNTVVGDALSELTHLDERIKQYDQHIEQAAKQDEQSRQLMRLAGIGPTTASAIVATVGKAHDFSCGRQFCAWLGLVPGQSARVESNGWGVLPRQVIPTCAPC